MTGWPGKRPVASLIVTGGSRGIGLACAMSGMRAGYAIAILYRNRSADAEQAVETIRNKGGSAIAIRADVGSSDQVEAAFAVIDRELPPIRALINNAGVPGPRGSLRDLSDAAVEELFRCNFFGAVRSTREAFRRMAISGGGHGGGIIMMTSQAATFGGSEIPAYAASKAALNAFTIGLARDAAKDGIRVNAISPGIIATRQHDDITDERRKAIAASLPMERMGTPEEVADTALWLLSDAASYVSGAIIPVHGAR